MASPTPRSSSGNPSASAPPSNLKPSPVLTHLPVHVLEAVRHALAQPADALSKVADASDGALRLRQAESFGALWTVDQIAQQLGIKQALGVTREAELS